MAGKFSGGYVRAGVDFQGFVGLHCQRRGAVNPVEKRELEEDEADYAARKREEAGKHLETLLGFIGGRRKSVSSSLSKRRLTDKAKMEVEESEEAIVALEKELDDLEAERDRALADVRRKWDGIAAEVSQITVQPFKKDVVISHFGVAWLPYYVVEGVEMPACSCLTSSDARQ